MSKNDHSHAMRFLKSLEVHCGEEVAKQFAEHYQLSKSASIKKKFEWAQEVCNYLEENYDEETAKEIRMECSCKTALLKLKKIKALYIQSGNEKAFAQSMNELEEGFTMAYENNAFYLNYPECYCPCVKK
nr:DUF6144 family protein [Cellulosilyticum ruminicola]